MSKVITIFFIVLLTIVILGILWVFVKNYIINQSKIIEEKKRFFSEDIKLLSVKLNNNNVSLVIKSSGGKVVTKAKEQAQTQKSKEVDLISIVDLSGSMRACHEINSWYCCYSILKGDYGSGNCYGLTLDREDSCTSFCSGTWIDRLTPAQNANKELINILFKTKNNKMGLVGYSSDIKQSASLDLTDNVGDLNNTINLWEARGATCLCCGINEAVKKLKQQSPTEKARTIIVMSDGDANIGCSEQGTGNAGQDAIQAACEANNTLTNLTIYSIGVGENVNENLLRNISKCGNGEYFSATNINDLIQVYKIVAEKIKVTYESVSQFNYLLIVFYNETSSYKEKVSEIPEPLETKSYVFNLTGKLEGKLQKIEIYPIFITNSGKELIGPSFDTWKRD